MNGPLSDANCNMKLGGKYVSLAQQFMAGRGPHTFAAPTNTSKKSEDNIFNQLNQALQAMPKAHFPVTPKLDPRFLVGSDDYKHGGQEVEGKSEVDGIKGKSQ